MSKVIKNSELILNRDGSIYHLHLRPENIARTIITVGDPERVDQVSKHFDSIDFKQQKREFKTHTGFLSNKRISVISTGIGTDNIDIVLNELDALVNIDLKNKTLKKNHTALNIVRIGTSGSIQKDIPVDSFLMNTFALDINGMLRSYELNHVNHPELEDAFVAHTKWDEKKAYPIIISNSKLLEDKIYSDKIYKGMTATAGGFYGPQGRILRLPIQDPDLNQKIDSFDYKGIRITILELETSAIYGLSKLLGHHACSINAILANRANGEFSKNPELVVNNLIQYTLDKLAGSL